MRNTDTILFGKRKGIRQSEKTRRRRKVYVYTNFKEFGGRVWFNIFTIETSVELFETV
jgi:hypothetical protein